MSERLPVHKVGAVILAAGSSSRLGRPKQLIAYDGQALVRRAAIAARRAGADEVIVVVGAFAGRVSDAVDGVNAVTVIHNKEWRSGLASSLAKGIRTAQTMGLDGAMVMTADQPLIEVEDLEKLINTFDEDTRVVAAGYNGIVGVPAVFGREHFDKLMNLTGEQGAGRWLRQHVDAAKIIDMPSAALDIDTLSDVARLQAL